MSHDIMSQFYTRLNLPLRDKLTELTRIIDHSSPNKELQAMFPQLVSNIFNSSFTNGWGLRTITFESNRYEFDALTGFLEPQGPMFRLCYKLLSDPQLKYNLPLNLLPMDMQMNLERGRCPQFYADMLTMDSQSLNVVALALNPFDYYIFSFALYLINNNQNKSSWENWNSVYFALACDYLVHFLPTDPNMPVLPHIPYYTGKVPMVAPLQNANRPLCSPSLLLISDLTGLSNQHGQHTTQSQARNEVWRSETVLQVFIDVWMSVEEFTPRGVDMYHRNYATLSSPERVRTVRVLVKHIHSFSAKHLSDPASRSSALRKYARQIMCARAYYYVKHLVTTWPLDAAFRLVMELWLSLIQPWRYTDNSISQERISISNNNQEGNSGTIDGSYTQFIAENFPSYTCILQLVLPRFMRLDLTAYKNAVMLFRLGKVFSQPHLVPILWNLEQAMADTSSGLHHSPDTSYNSTLDQSYTYNGIPLHKWVAIAKQALSELNLSANYEYEPIWSENRKQYTTEFVKKILSAQSASERNLEEQRKRINHQYKGIMASIKHWLMLDNQSEEESLLEESKKVPVYLNASMHHFSSIFGLNENTLVPPEPEDNSIEHSSFANSSSFPLHITSKLYQSYFITDATIPTKNNYLAEMSEKTVPLALAQIAASENVIIVLLIELFILLHAAEHARDQLRSTPAGVHYMGDPDLMPITSYESTILVRMLYQIASRINELYQEQFTSLWRKNNFYGYVAREILQKPCRIHTYVKDASHQNVVSEELGPRLSLRRLGSHAFIAWVTIGYIIFRLCSFSGFSYLFILFVLWTMFILTKVCLKMLKIMNE